MIAQESCRFASAAWWDDHPHASLVIVHAILALSSNERTPEDIWLSPSVEEWRRVAELAAQYSDDGALSLTGEQISWQILSRVVRGDSPHLDVDEADPEKTPV